VVPAADLRHVAAFPRFQAGAGHDELRIPLRIFDVGIRYLRTGDRRVLLDLLSEERQILGEALGLESPAE